MTSLLLSAMTFILCDLLYCIKDVYKLIVFSITRYLHIPFIQISVLCEVIVFIDFIHKTTLPQKRLMTHKIIYLEIDVPGKPGIYIFMFVCAILAFVKSIVIAV